MKNKERSRLEIKNDCHSADLFNFAQRGIVEKASQFNVNWHAND